MADVLSKSSPKPRVGFVNFINTSQIYIPWKESGGAPGWEIVEGPPVLLNRLLDAGKIEVGIVSSYFYGLNFKKYLIFPGLSISATGTVGSVTLFSKVPLKRLQGRIVIVTQYSATSANLVKIVLEDFLGVKPIYMTGDFSLLNKKDVGASAYLAIGDEALRLRERIDFDQIDLSVDLAEIWLNNTGLPFVFAVWAIRKECIKDTSDALTILYRKLNHCRLQGQQELERISDIAAIVIPMDKTKCLDYLRGIELDLTEEKQKGLLHFFDLLNRRGDFPKISSLSFFEAFAT
ncbi:MAG: menaquinone biosynthetic enzyme MqnA/MqnD family protein [Dissulfurimicrobium sp.]|uniref:menaquinone biosynthetic enzyme MqnA/MqnD family protein n=1 Tax=Dissulfurimicrobium TaxID=1769732 RepID=UPI001EDB19EB|nr:menaquinone biosynthesis protein [Dissulfurimicrobium hydrothermale]UKL13197.1 menaquinone biosynthesis protein [Dissulfurimicrobium hydrothermale]